MWNGSNYKRKLFTGSVYSLCVLECESIQKLIKLLVVLGASWSLTSWIIHLELNVLKISQFFCFCYDLCKHTIIHSIHTIYYIVKINRLFYLATSLVSFRRLCLAFSELWHLNLCFVLYKSVLIQMCTSNVNLNL